MTFIISPEERELVLARMEVLSPDLVFSTGGTGKSYSRDELIAHVQQGDDVGNAFVKIELEFLRALKSGKLMEQLVGTTHG